jgi:hypothetical protein
LDLLEGDDNYARDAARTILEQQGFLDQHLAALGGSDFTAKNRARHFFIKMAELGNSIIAREVVKQHHLDEKPTSSQNDLSKDHKEHQERMPDHALNNREGS